MPWARPETCEGLPGMLHTLRARLGPSRTSPRTSLVLPPTRSKPPVLPCQKATVRPQVDVSAGGSLTIFRRRFASLCLTISGCETKSAGRCLTAELACFMGRRGHLDYVVLLHGGPRGADMPEGRGRAAPMRLRTPRRS